MKTSVPSRLEIDPGTRSGGLREKAIRVVMPLESHPDAFAKFLLATLRGIKKGNPQAKVLIEGGPWNMDPKLGTKWVERYIQDTRRIDPTVQFDGAACHHYRNFPENPDLDADIAAFLEMLDRNGCGRTGLFTSTRVAITVPSIFRRKGFHHILWDQTMRGTLGRCPIISEGPRESPRPSASETGWSP